MTWACDVVLLYCWPSNSASEGTSSSSPRWLTANGKLWIRETTELGGVLSVILKLPIIGVIPSPLQRSSEAGRSWGSCTNIILYNVKEISGYRRSIIPNPNFYKPAIIHSSKFCLSGPHSYLVWVYLNWCLWTQVKLLGFIFSALHIYGKTKFSPSSYHNPHSILYFTPIDPPKFFLTYFELWGLPAHILFPISQK